MNVQLEICVETVASAIAAHKGGAHRVELCSGLVEGGVTPSIGLVRAVVQCIPIPVHVLIRPRAGDFVFSEDEMKAMECDINECAKAGATGVVVGALTPGGDIDEPKLNRLVQCAAQHSLHVTFHRAFDHTKDPMAALRVLISSGGVKRILTSGQRATAEEGVGVIQQLVGESQGRIQIMAGGGVTPENAATIITRSGVAHIHASARSLGTQPEPIHSNPLCPFRATTLPPEGVVMQTDAEKVSAILIATHAAKESL
ncbi:hypothetical protein CLOP_g373 [Closterium sp. NIES-67]|nr:hypothetical protein CLOP_g373 [Closterium sp. NIES-67]